MGQLLNIVENIDKVVINGCDTPEEEKTYRQAIKNSFIRLDSYYEQNNLYKYRDFNFFINDVISGKHSFNVTRKEDIDWAGACERSISYEQHTKVIIPINYLQTGTTLEGILDHEIGHLQTTGTGLYVYMDEQGNIINLFTGFSNLKVVNSSRSVPMATTLKNRVIIEGNTELFKQTRYTAQECYHTYQLETRLIGLLNALCGKDELTWQIEYLRGEFISYNEFFGKQTNAFIKLLEQADANKEFEFTTPNRPIYNKCIDLIVKTFLHNLETGIEPFNLDNIIRKSSALFVFFEDDTTKFDYYLELFTQSLQNRLKLELDNGNLTQEQKKNLYNYIASSLNLSFEKYRGIPVPSNNNEVVIKNEYGQIYVGIAGTNAKINIPLENRINQSTCQSGNKQIIVTKNEDGSYQIKTQKIERLSNLSLRFVDINSLTLHISKRNPNLINVENNETLESITINTSNYFEKKQEALKKKYGIKSNNKEKEVDLEI